MNGREAGALVIEVFVARSTRWCVRFRSGGADIYNYYRTRTACLRGAITMLNGVARKKLPNPPGNIRVFRRKVRGSHEKSFPYPPESRSDIRRKVYER
jgi:hypothetical protein